MKKKEPSKRVKSLLEELRERYALGHGKGCHCKPCARLRSDLAELGALDLIYDKRFF